MLLTHSSESPTHWVLRMFKAETRSPQRLPGSDPRKPFFQVDEWRGIREARLLFVITVTRKTFKKVALKMSRGFLLSDLPLGGHLPKPADYCDLPGGLVAKTLSSQWGMWGEALAQSLVGELRFLPSSRCDQNEYINKQNRCCIAKANKKSLLIIKLCSMHRVGSRSEMMCVYVCVGRSHPNYKNVWRRFLKLPTQKPWPLCLIGRKIRNQWDLIQRVISCLNPTAFLLSQWLWVFAGEITKYLYRWFNGQFSNRWFTTVHKAKRLRV